MTALWRIVVVGGVLALAALVFFIVQSNLRSASFLHAVRSGDGVEVRRLLEKEPDLLATKVMPQGSRSTNGQTRWRGRTPMHYVVSGWSANPVAVADAMLAAGLDVNARLNGDSYLHLAADAGDLTMMAWLLDHGTDVNVRNACEHPVEAICASGKFAEWQPSDRLRVAGTGCTGCDHDGQTPLHAVQRSSHAYEGTLLLLARGADLNAVDAIGRTALHVAAQAGRQSQDQRVLCAYGADPAVRDRNGKLAADLARETDQAKTVDRYSQTGPGELAGWLAPGGGCATVAARARPGAPVPEADVDAAWRAYACSRVPKYCGG